MTPSERDRERAHHVANLSHLCGQLSYYIERGDLMPLQAAIRMRDKIILALSTLGVEHREEGK